MKCNKFPTLEGCSKCNYSLDDNEYISLLDSVSIIDILDVLTERHHFPLSNMILLNESTIDCRGNITLVYHNTSINFTNNSARYIYYSILSKWLRSNLSNIYNSINIIYLVLCACILNYNEKDQKALELIENFQAVLNYIRNYIKILQRNKNF